MKRTLLDLVTSKKFLAAVTAVVIYIAGRFGFNVDTAILDRIYLALLAFVGAQGIADNGKEAAKIWTGAAPDARPPGVPALPIQVIRVNPPVAPAQPPPPPASAADASAPAPGLGA